LEIVAHPGRAVVGDGAPYHLTVVGVDARHEALEVARGILGADAEDPAQRLVPLEAAAAAVPDPGAHAAGLDRLAQAPLALAQRLLGAAPLGDFEAGDQQEDRLPVFSDRDEAAVPVQVADRAHL